MSDMPSWLGAIANRAVAASTKLNDLAARLYGGAPRKFRREDLEAREAWFATVIDRLSQGLVVFDKDRRVVLCNARYRELYG